ncbi:hypothetical protein HPB50_013626 [Hyalomma asiaticum]|uniref:Uncharacterized protein n=1 Tax=Hyalomma asiaticum TaxID=266040 RepID=A0ACB7T784_HYAAI|nr:hypothetical protein HPB50_013626 [Hyalomma asiaticum]
MDASTGAIPKRPSKRKVRAKLSFGSTRAGNSSLPCHLQANLTDLIALLETPQKRDKHRSDLTINATEETGPTKATTIVENCEDESVHSTKPLVDVDCEVVTSTVVDPQSSLGDEDQAVRIEKPEPKGLTEIDVLDIARQMRQVLHKKCPSQEHELVGAVSPTHAKLKLETRGTTAFLDTRPRFTGFIVFHEDFYSFMYYEDPDGEVRAGSSSPIKDKAITGPSSTWFQRKRGHQNAAARDGAPDTVCVAISSSRPHRESAFERKHPQEEKHALKDIQIQVPPPPHSRSVQMYKRQSDVESPTDGCPVSRMAESESTKENYDSDNVQLHLRSMEHSGGGRQSACNSPVQISAGSAALPGPPRSAAAQKKSPAMNDLTHTDAKSTIAIRSSRSRGSIPMATATPEGYLPPRLTPKSTASSERP